MNQSNSPAFYQPPLSNPMPSQVLPPQTPTGYSSIPPPHTPGSTQTHNIDFSSTTTNFNVYDLNSLLSSFQVDSVQDEIPEPTSKCKELLNQLKSSIQGLLTQLTIFLNPSNESKPMSENQFQLFGKNVESFNKVSDLLIVNLRAACEAQVLVNDLRNYYKYHAYIDQTDAMRVDGQIINSVVIQMQRINELKTILHRFSTVEDIPKTI